MPPDALTRAHLEAGRRLRALTEQQVALIWRALPGHDRENVDRWLSAVLPVVDAAKRQSATVTDAYLARKLNRAPLGTGVPVIRRGAAPEDVYRRPFVTLWSALGDHRPFDDAFNAALARATSTAAMDVQLSMRETALAVQQGDDAIYGYERVANPGACQFCQEIDGAFVKSADAMALHNNCGCGLEPLTAPRRGASLPDGVAVHGHGELGPLLTSPEHSFTTESQI